MGSSPQDWPLWEEGPGLQWPGAEEIALGGRQS